MEVFSLHIHLTLTLFFAAELGDFIDEFTDQSYFQSCKIMQNQTPKLEEKIIEHHKVHVYVYPEEFFISRSSPISDISVM